MDTDFKVKTGEFEGPLELLLELIERRKLHINSISISQVAEDFLEHIKSLDSFPMKDSADFILIASTLLLIKSKSLLPNLPLTEEEESNIENLEDRLKEYQKYKKLSLGIQNMFGNFLFFAEEPKGRDVFFTPTTEINTENLYKAIMEVLKNIPKETRLPKILVEKIISLEEMMGNLAKRMQNSFKMSFKDFSGKSNNLDKAQKINVIVSFLAMLELVKRGIARVNQENHFADIEIENEQLNTPTY